jgi:hypothetical protein
VIRGSVYGQQSVGACVSTGTGCAQASTIPVLTDDRQLRSVLPQLPKQRFLEAPARVNPVRAQSRVSDVRRACNAGASLQLFNEGIEREKTTVAGAIVRQVSQVNSCETKRAAALSAAGNAVDA